MVNLCIADMCPFSSDLYNHGAKSLFVKSLTEFIGTFIFIHSICLTVNNYTFSAAIPIGLTLMVVIFTWGHVSGGNFNPAVSTGLWVAGKIDGVIWICYLIAQFLGAIVGGVLAAAIADDDLGFPTINVEENKSGLWTEFLYTFLLVSAVCNTACTASHGYKNNGFFGLAIGSSVIAGAASSGWLSGGAFNSAVLVGVNIGACVFDSDIVENPDAASWILVMLMHFLGGIAAGLYFAVTESIDDDYIKQSTERMLAKTSDERMSKTEMTSTQTRSAKI